MAKLGEKSGETPLIYQIILVVLILGLLFFALKNFVIDDMHSQIEALDAEIAKLDLQIKRAQAYEQKRAQYKQIYEARLKELDTKKAILPKERETDELVRRLERLAKDAQDISITMFRPQNTIDHDFYYEWPIAINCEAGFNSLGMFFQQIANFERIFNVYNLKMESLHAGSDAKPTIKAAFTASTFVYTGDDSEKIQ